MRIGKDWKDWCTFIKKSGLPNWALQVPCSYLMCDLEAKWGKEKFSRHYKQIVAAFKSIKENAMR